MWVFERAGRVNDFTDWYLTLPTQILTSLFVYHTSPIDFLTSPTVFLTPPTQVLTSLFVFHTSPTGCLTQPTVFLTLPVSFSRALERRKLLMNQTRMNSGR